MASVFKRGYWAEVRGKRVRRKCRTYTVKWRDANGLHTITGYPEQAASEELGRKAELLSRLRARREAPDAELTEWVAKLPDRVREDLAKEGVLDPRPAIRRKPLKDHIADYKADLEATGRDEEYVYIAERRLQKLLVGLHWETLSDLEANAFTTWRAARAKQLAPKTLNEYLQALRAFLNWCRQQGRLDGDPLAGVRPVDGRGKERRKRRALTLDELERLFHVAENVTKDDRNHPITPRALVYKVTLYCQLRRADTEALKWDDVNLDVLPGYLVTRAETSKGKRDTRHPLRSDLAAELRAVRPADARPSDPVFPYVPGFKQFKADLKRAGIEYKDEFGRQADFHAMGRQTPNTMMALAGVAPRTAQELMRHTDIKLTMGPYIDPNMLNKAAAVEALPELGKGKHRDQAEPAILKLSGTGDEPLAVDAIPDPSEPLNHPLNHGHGESASELAIPSRPIRGEIGETRDEPAKDEADEYLQEPEENAVFLADFGGELVAPDGALVDLQMDKGKSGPLGLEPSDKPCQSSTYESTEPPTEPRSGLAGPVADMVSPDEQMKDPDLAEIAMAWPNLPSATRAAVMAVVRTASGR